MQFRFAFLRELVENDGNYGALTVKETISQRATQLKRYAR